MYTLEWDADKITIGLHMIYVGLLNSQPERQVLLHSHVLSHDPPHEESMTCTLLLCDLLVWELGVSAP